MNILVFRDSTVLEGCKCLHGSASMLCILPHRPTRLAAEPFNYLVVKTCVEIGKTLHLANNFHKCTKVEWEYKINRQKTLFASKKKVWNYWPFRYSNSSVQESQTKILDASYAKHCFISQDVLVTMSSRILLQNILVALHWVWRRGYMCMCT